MASTRQLFRDWQEKVEQVRLLNAELSSMRAEMESVAASLKAYREEYEAKSSDIQQREAELTQREGDVRVALSRTEAGIQGNIDRLNEQLLSKVQESKVLDSYLAVKAAEREAMEAGIRSLQSDTARLTGELDERHAEYAREAKRLSEAQISLQEAQGKRDEALAELEEIRAQSGHLTKLRHDLDMYHRRIKNYYEKAGLHFVDDQYVGISPHQRRAE